jgi:trimethylamine:corrinoid methyltransferase-like protein
LSKQIDHSKDKYKQKAADNDNDIESGIFTKRIWEPFNIAFYLQDLENNARQSKPKNYNDFLNILNKDSTIGIILK